MKQNLRRTILLLVIISTIISCNSNIDLKPTQPTSKPVLITGKVLNQKQEKNTVTIYVWEIPSVEQKTYVSSVDSFGDFQIKFDQYYPQDVLLRYGDDAFPVIVHPTDSIHIVFDADNISDKKELAQTIQFSGDAAGINSSLIDFHSQITQIYIPWEKYREYEKDYSIIEFTKMLDSLKSEKEILMKNFISKQGVSEELKTWMKYEIEMDYNNKLARFPIDKARFNNLNYDTIVPTSFYDFMNVSFPKEALSNSNSTSFIGRYRYGRLKSLEYKAAKKYYVEGVIGFFLQLTKDVYFGSPTKEDLDIIISSTNDKFLKEILIAKCLYDCIQRREITEFEKHYSLFNKIVHEPFLREPIINTYIKTKRHLDNPELGENSLLSSTNDTPANELIEKIIEEHKGQIIYLDIWATWCDPCRKEMPYSKELMNTLNSDKVDFVYLCTDSKEDKWKALITEMEIEGSHYFATPEQSRFIYELFEMSGVPHYVLIDKKGNIEDKGFQLRPSGSLVKNKIENLLNK